MSRTWSAALLVSAVVTASVLAGCSAGVPSDGPVAVYPKPDAGMDALLEGILQTEGGCVAVATPDGTVIVPQFPSGDAAWSDGALTWRGADYRDGDRIAIGGGVGAAGGTDDGYMPQACQAYESWVVSPY
ncbi:hypothetical protein [Microbacterium sp. H1-D42]|uniref:hypothetical protein n=1 Tax=Microbacterium sp. H1-D42 TaxID=2925844 RepID=UPI001F538B4A|nr:hypothetical protein [Microbacterium sp. H1-D42]UNK70175.1 hypothetical protein MNR00_13540 [Microbacterium sp. H1-D42]